MAVIDSHVHYIDDDALDYIDTVLRHMDENGVDKSVLFGVQGDPICGDAGVWHAWNTHPDRFIPFACSLRCELPRDAEVFLNYISRQPWQGVGEVYLDITGEDPPGVTFTARDGSQIYYPHYCPADKHRNAVYGEVFARCGERGLPVMVHCRSIAVMSELLAMFPGTNFIWAHADHGYWAGEPAPMLDQYPNLYCEVGIGFRFESEKLLSETSDPNDDWLRKLFGVWQAAASRHPSRILWGSDVFLWSDLDPHTYRRWRQVFTLFCEPLSAEAAAGVAGGNLLSLLPR